MNPLLKKMARRALRPLIVDILQDRETVDDILFPILQARLQEEEEKRNQVFIHVFPGGKMPVRSTDGSIGYDGFIRSIVSAKEMDPMQPHLRKPIFDFDEIIPRDPDLARKIGLGTQEENRGRLVYRMDPYETVTVGLGCATAMGFPMFYWVAPRSGYASRENVTVTNAPGTVDPDYRGEAGVLVYNRNDYSFEIGRHMRIAQTIYQRAIIPSFIQVENYKDLPVTIRGAEGFGSTGHY